MRDIAHVLVKRERETADLKRAMYTLSEQLKAERQRADAAEAKTREVLNHFKNTNELKIAAEQDAARANEGLRLYKLQYENAQEEIRRAQKLIDSLEAQRLDAEEAAAKARTTARKLKEEKVIMQAREEGRRQGIEEGMAQGRAMGYEEGRTAGYEHGRAAAEEEFMSAPVTEMGYATPRAREYVPPEVSRPSTSEDSLPQPVMPDYTQPMDTTEPLPPPVTTPARIPTPSETIPVEEPVPELRPISIRNTMFSPSHPAVDIPPEGWIPTLDGDNRIRLPPPHEMAPPPPTSPEPLSAVLNNVKNIPEEPVMIPPPSNSAAEASSRKAKHRRRNSTDSHSTTMSQFEILGPPTPAGTMPRSVTRDRPNVLSAIAEERERTSSASSPVYDMPNVSNPHASIRLSPVSLTCHPCSCPPRASQCQFRAPTCPYLPHSLPPPRPSHRRTRHTPTRRLGTPGAPRTSRVRAARTTFIGRIPPGTVRRRATARARMAIGRRSSCATATVNSETNGTNGSGTWSGCAPSMSEIARNGRGSGSARTESGGTGSVWIGNARRWNGIVSSGNVRRWNENVLSGSVRRWSENIWNGNVQ